MKRTFCILFSALLLFFAGCVHNEKKVYSAVESDVFDTVCSLLLADDGTGKETADLFFAELRRLDGLFNAYKDADFPNLKTVNDEAGKSAVRVDRELTDLLGLMLEFSKLSKGVVTPMIGSVSILWKKASESGSLPDPDALNESRKHISDDVLIVDREAGTVFITDPDARVDVGSAAKGYAALIMTRWLEDRNITDFVLSFGGSVAARGKDPRTGKPWKVGVKDPFSDGEDAAKTLLLENASLVTSGSYERCFTVGGVSYHHILDPETGAPSRRTDTVSATVLHTDPALGDLLSTALFILPFEEGKELLRKTGGEALWIAENGIRSSTGGFADKGTRASNADAITVALLLCALFAAVIALVIRKKAGSVRAQKRTEDEGGERKTAGFSFRRRDVLLLSLLSALALILPLFLLLGKTKSAPEAVVRIDNEVVWRGALEKDAEYRAEIDGSYNVVTVKGGKVYVSESDCPGKDCVRCGAIDERSSIPVIACIPHRLIVTVEDRDGEGS